MIVRHASRPLAAWTGCAAVLLASTLPVVGRQPTTKTQEAPSYQRGSDGVYHEVPDKSLVEAIRRDFWDNVNVLDKQIVELSGKVDGDPLKTTVEGARWYQFQDQHGETIELLIPNNVPDADPNGWPKPGPARIRAEVRWDLEKPVLEFRHLVREAPTQPGPWHWILAGAGGIVLIVAIILIILERRRKAGTSPPAPAQHRGEPASSLDLHEPPKRPDPNAPPGEDDETRPSSRIEHEAVLSDRIPGGAQDRAPPEGTNDETGQTSRIEHEAVVSERIAVARPDALPDGEDDEHAPTTRIEYEVVLSARMPSIVTQPDDQGTLKILPGYLDVRTGTAAGQRIHIYATEVLLGRGRGEGLGHHHIGFDPDDRSVSRRQAKLLYDRRSRVFRLVNLADPASKNATAVRGKEMASGETTDLRDGDKIRVGKIELEFHEIKAGQ